MKKLCLIFLLMVTTSPLLAKEDCSTANLFSYFPEKFVLKALEKYLIPPNLWKNIQEELAKQDKEIMKIIEQKVSKKDPSLLQDFSRRQELTPIFQETLLEILSKVLKNNGITDPTVIKGILEDIQKQKVNQFKNCLNSFTGG